MTKQNQDPSTRVSRAGKNALEPSLTQDDSDKGVKKSQGARLLAIDIDGTLLDSSYQIPPENLAALRRAHQAGVEIVLVTGRRHAFALPTASELGFDLWIISSNGAVTRSLTGETFHRDLLPLETARALCAQMDEFRGNLVITFDREGKGALLLEHLEELTLSIRRWLEKNMECIEFSRPIEQALGSDPLQAMFCGSVERMRQAAAVLASAPVRAHITQLKTEYPARDLCILDVLNRDCSKGHALERWARHRGIAAEEVVAIGDNHNDAEMLNFAGRAFIMENAAPELKENGWTVTRSNDACGVAAVVDLLVE